MQNNNIQVGDDALEQLLETKCQQKIDVNALKNEILTDGMQVSI